MKDFKCTQCGDCCGPVPIAESELAKLKEAVQAMPNRLVSRLKSQKRNEMLCIFYDKKYKQCAVYESRPEICKMFGFYQGMQCDNNPGHATKSLGEGNKRLKEHQTNPAGILSISVGWDELLSK
ncbi:YkgJ family cysteine cluster protein [Priestia megaterium]|uniref:YkgJ family cysteine cluster protein n=1 Tax=Priestia megaterium TaxID=1404 RepID=UPI002E1CC9B8|nr:YkgJ family cysteine cluster protein [Priestia megaterium]